MNIILNLVSRNMKNYLRDKAAVFFSFMSVIIILFLYLFFLGDMQIDNIVNSISDMPDFMSRHNDIIFMVNSWLVAGLLAVNTITIPITILSRKVEDRVSKISDDFNATPAKRYQIMLGYIISAWIIGIATSIFILIFGEIYIVMKGGQFLSIISLLKVLGILSLAIIMFSGLFYFIIDFIKTASQLNMINTLVGTFSGFLGGIYVPLGVLGSIGKVIKLFPLSHIASLLRQVFMATPIANVFEGAPVGVAQDIRYIYGVDLSIGSHHLLAWELVLIIIGFSLVFYTLSIILYTRFKRKK